MASLELVVGVAFVGLLVVVAESILCPSTCPCLAHLVDCSRRGLIEIPHDLPVWVEILELQNNDITSVPDDVFKELVNLQQLDLSHNQLRSVNATAFQHLPHLRELKIQNNHLREIPDLGHLSNLTLLSLHHNEIHSVSLTALAGLSNLMTLDLNHNRIVDLAVGSFPNNTRLLHLYLNNNRIINIEQGSLDNLTHLETLRLNKNRLSTFPKDLFRKLRCLKTLELNRNQLVQVEGLTFHGLESLQVLRLQNNAIRLLLDGAFWGLNNIQQLKLDHNNITVVTKGWLYGLGSLQQLSLRHNRINEIEDDGWEFCQQLWELELPNNRLQAIRRGTFAKLGKLQHLNLNHNRISYVEDGAFRGLHSLQTLELNNNEISWAIEDMNGAFVGLDRLTKLGLESNTITSIAKRAFLGLDSLEHLELGDNAINNIQNNAFQGMKDLQQLRFNSSNFLCDCELQWLAEWLLQSGFQTSVTARCAHPEWLKGKSIFDISPEDFTCKDFPKPYLNEEPQTQITLKGANVTLVCRAASSSDSPMIFVWKKDNMNIKNARVEKFANTSDGSIVEYTSVLMLWNISDKDEGRYQCVVTNHFGSTYSQKAKITVHVYPLFVKTPADVTVKAGSTARLECAAQGQPQPVIAWQKDGGDDFPAARERRMHVMPTDDVFFIVNVKSSDMGMYSCTAQNAVGLIMANATLVVLETPSFVKAIEDKKTEVGETTVLECMATGSPKPKLTWMKDGEPLIPTERHFFTADNQLLVIVQTQYSDGGMYTCEMSNTLGTERGTAQLKVLLAHSVSMEDESMTTGIIIIAVVCCVVLTSLVWVIIIYQTRKRSEEFSPTNSDETTLPEELTPYPSFPTACTSAFQGSAAHLYIDNHSEHSSKDSGTGDSTERSQDALLPHQQHPPVAPMETKGLHVIVRGPSAASLQGPASDSSLDTLTSTPSTRTTSSGDAFPARPTNHERLIPVVLARAALHPVPNAAEVTRWSAGRSHSVDLPSESSPAPRANQLDGSHNLGYATFPRNVSPSQNSWNTGSLRHLRLPRDVQNDSGSFSIESEDARSFQPLLVPSSRMQRHSITSLPDPYNLPLTGIPQQSPLPLPSQRFHAAATKPRC